MSDSKESTYPPPPRAALTAEEQDTLIWDLASAYAVEDPQSDDITGQVPIARSG